MFTCSARLSAIIAFIGTNVRTAFIICAVIAVIMNIAGQDQLGGFELAFSCILLSGAYHYHEGLKKYPFQIGADQGLKKESYRFIESEDQIIRRGKHAQHSFRMCASTSAFLLLVEFVIYYMYNIDYMNGVMIAFFDIWF